MMLMIDEFEEKYCPNGETKFIRYPNVKRNVDSKKHKERSENNIFMTGQQKVKETYNVDPKLSAVTNNVKSSL